MSLTSEEILEQLSDKILENYTKEVTKELQEISTSLNHLHRKVDESELNLKFLQSVMQSFIGEVAILKSNSYTTELAIELLKLDIGELKLKLFEFFNHNGTEELNGSEEAKDKGNLT